MTAPQVTPETLETTASRWFARKRSGEMTAAEGAELDAWLAADPEHRALYDQAEYWWGAGPRHLLAQLEDLRVSAQGVGRAPPVFRLVK